MGWWQDRQNGKTVLIGDDTLDLTGDYLREFSRVFKEEMKRRPTLAELLRHLDVGLAGCGDDVIDDLERVEVTGITASTKRRPRRQKYEVGTVFQVPVMRGKVGYGRVVYDSEEMGPLGVFYGPVNASIPWHVALQDQPAFYTYFGKDALRDGRWKICGFLPRQANEETPMFVMGDQEMMPSWSFVMKEDVKIRAATAEDFELYPEYAIDMSGRIVDMFKRVAKGLPP